MSKATKYINYEEITTAIMDVVMPNREKEPHSIEVANQLKMTNIIGEKLLSKYIGTLVTIIRNHTHDGKLFLVHTKESEAITFGFSDDKFQPAVLGEIKHIDDYDPEKDNEHFLKPEDYYNSFKYDLYPGYDVDDEPKSDADAEIITRLKFIKENHLEDKYAEICGIYFYEFFKYATKVLIDEEITTEDFDNLNRIRPDYIMTPVLDYDLNLRINIYNRC